MKNSVFVFGLLLLASPAFAQDATTDPAPAAQPSTVQAKPVAQPAKARTGLAEQSTAGTWVGTLGTMFSYNSSSNDLLAGGTNETSTYLVRMELGIGAMIIDQLEIGLVGGLLLRRLGRENNDSATERDWLIQARTTYIIPVTGGLGFGLGAAVGPYFGSSERDVVSTAGTINETTSTFGVATDGNLGVIYGVSEHLQLRMMVDLTWLYGSESIPSANKDLTVSTTNLGLGLSLGYVF